jgi:hypothetical protein
MRARVLSFNPGKPQDLEDELNDFLSGAGSIRIENVSTTGDSDRAVLIVLYSETSTKARPAQVCAQCKKKPPMPGLKTCEGCRDYQRDYRQKRKTESKTRYP